MKTNSFLSRFRLMKARPADVSEDDASSEIGHRPHLVKKSELKALFHKVLEEKRDDLPSRRR